LQHHPLSLLNQTIGRRWALDGDLPRGGGRGRALSCRSCGRVRAGDVRPKSSSVAELRADMGVTLRSSSRERVRATTREKAARARPCGSR
jgi:hypothetical protein